jgi:thiol-disulfide isomerase/thioredoxin
MSGTQSTRTVLRRRPVAWLVWFLLGGVLAATPAAGQAAKAGDVVAEVRAAIAARDLDRAGAIVAKRRAEQGTIPEVLEALSWLGRGALAQGELDRADRYAREAQRLAVASLGTGSIDRAPRLATAIGAGIEVQAQVLGQRGQRSEAVYFLQRELETYKDTSIHKRIQKNINLLSLEGRPAPALDRSEYIGPPPPSLAELKGKVLVLFFWAHWCSDCKAQGPILAELLAKYQAQGLAVVAPTQRFGYVGGGAAAGPDEERQYILQVRDGYYGFLKTVPVPMSEANHKLYGVSSTPTLVVVDRQGIVKLYHPGRMTRDALEQQLLPLLVPLSARAAVDR